MLWKRQNWCKTKQQLNQQWATTRTCNRKMRTWWLLLLLVAIFFNLPRRQILTALCRLPSDNEDVDESTVKNCSVLPSICLFGKLPTQSPRSRRLPGLHGWNLRSSSSWQCRRDSSEFHTRLCSQWKTGTYRRTGANQATIINPAMSNITKAQKR